MQKIITSLLLAQSSTAFFAPNLAPSTKAVQRAQYVIMSAAVEPALSTLRERFGHLASGDAKVPTVGETMQLFNAEYSKPILPMFRSLMNDIVQSTHLAVVDARFQYDAIFAFGLRESFTTIMRAYPAPGEADKMFAAMVTALRLEPATVTADADAVAEWVKNASATDFEAASRGEGTGPLSEAVTKAMSDEWFLYSRTWRTGLFLAAEHAGIEPTPERVAAWAALMKFPATKAATDLEDYRNVLQKMADAEIMFKEIEIREKKRMADRLEEQAKKALAKAAKADASAAEMAAASAAAADAAEHDAEPVTA